MKSLRGVSIGLHATMNKDQMKQHITKLRDKWKNEGYEDVDGSIVSKCNPLVSGCYWSRTPQASKVLSEVLNELGLDSTRYRDKPKKTKMRKSKSMDNYLNQFKKGK